MIWRILSLGCTLALAAARSHAACLAPGAAPTPAAVVDAQFAYYNAHNVDAFASCYAENIEMVYLDGSQPPIRGRAGILAAFSFLKTMPGEMGVKIVQRTITGPTVVDKEHVVGLPSGKLLPDMAAIYEVRDGQIVKVWFPPSH